MRTQKNALYEENRSYVLLIFTEMDCYFRQNEQQNRSSAVSCRD